MLFLFCCLFAYCFLFCLIVCLVGFCGFFVVVVVWGKGLSFFVCVEPRKLLRLGYVRKCREKPVARHRSIRRSRRKRMMIKINI